MFLRPLYAVKGLPSYFCYPRKKEVGFLAISWQAVLVSEVSTTRQGKEVDPWNLPIPSAPCYRTSLRFSRPDLPDIRGDRHGLDHLSASPLRDRSHLLQWPCRRRTLVAVSSLLQPRRLGHRGRESGTGDEKAGRVRGRESGTGPILGTRKRARKRDERDGSDIVKLGGPADVRAIFNRARHFDFVPPFAGDPWDDRPTLGPNVSRFPSAIPAGQRGGLVARCGEALPVPARRRFD